MRKSGPTQITETKVSAEYRRRKRRKREEEYRRRIEGLRRQIEDARRRRQRLMLLILLAVLAMQEFFLAAFQRSYIDWPDPHAEPENWTPDPERDFAAQPGHNGHCDGYSYEQWTRMLNARGIKVSRKAEIKTEWHADPDYELFPARYQLWDHKPYLGQLMEELTAPYWKADAFSALKLLSPHETHQYLNEAYATDPADIRQCLADHDADIIVAFQSRAVLWEERKRREAEEAQKAEKDKKPDDDEKKIEP